MSVEDYKKYEPIDGKWYINRELGKGAFGVVLEVERRDFSNTKSAMKIISIPSSQSEIDSFREDHYELDEASITSYFYGFVEDVTKEFKIMSQLRGNSNIVSFEDYSIEKHTDGIGWDIFIRMELLTPMNKYFAEHTLTTQDVIKLGIDICKALEVCSKYNIIHRDIKPANIFISDMGEFKLGDFGIARTLEKTSSSLSQKGTYTYMAPEVYKGENYGTSVDLYSLGIVMYKLLNNNYEPFRTNMTHGDVQNAFALRMRGAEMPKPLNADGELANVILKACSYDPNDRFESPSAMREALEKLLYSEVSESVVYGNNHVLDFEPSKENVSDQDEDTEVMIDEQQPKKITQPQKKKSFWKQPKSWGILAAAAVIVIVIASFFGRGIGLPKNSDLPALILTPEEEISNEQMQIIEKNLQARVKLFDNQVSLEKEDGYFRLAIKDKAVFGRDAEEKEYNLNLLKSKGDFRVNVPMASWIGDFGKEGIEEVVVEKEELSKFKLLLADKIDKETAKLLENDEAEEVNYLHITLNSQAAMYFRECIAHADEKNSYMQAVGNTDLNIVDGQAYMSEYDDLGYVIDINPDGSEFYVLPMYFDSEFSVNLLCSVLQGDIFECSLIDQMDEKTNWETDETVFGKKQVAKMSGKQIVIEAPCDVYVSEYDDKTSDEKFNGYVENIKKRLDKLNIDYMIGFKGIDSRTLVVKTSPEAIGSDFVRLLLSEKSVEIYSQFRNIYTNTEAVQTARDSEGNIGLKLVLDKTKEELIKEYDNGFNLDIDWDEDETSAEDDLPTEVGTGEGKNIYLVVNDVTVASAELSKVDGNTVYFSNFLCFNDGKATDEELPVLELICSINDETETYSVQREDLKVWYSENGDTWEESANIPWKYDAKTDVDKAVMSKLNSMGYEVTKSVTSRNSLDIVIDVKEDGDFVSNFIAKVKDIYMAGDFDSGSYYMVFMRIKGESDKNNADRARFVTNKDSYSNSVKLVAIFSGPTYGKYADEVKALCENDEFFIQRGINVMK